MNTLSTVVLPSAIEADFKNFGHHYKPLVARSIKRITNAVKTGNLSIPQQQKIAFKLLNQFKSERTGTLAFDTLLESLKDRSEFF